MNTEARAVAFFWGILRRYVSETNMEKIKGMRMCEDHMGCVFDVPLAEKDEILDQLSHLRYGEVTVLNELPCLVEIKEMNSSSWGKRRPEQRFNSQTKRPRMDSRNGRGNGRGNPPNRFSNSYAKKF